MSALCELMGRELRRLAEMWQDSQTSAKRLRGQSASNMAESCRDDKSAVLMRAGARGDQQGACVCVCVCVCVCHLPSEQMSLLPVILTQTYIKQFSLMAGDEGLTRFPLNAELLVGRHAFCCWLAVGKAVILFIPSFKFSCCERK